jgi:hypothetical protein
MTAKSASAATAQAMNLSSSGWGHIPDSGEGRDEILHTHNDHGRFPAAVYDKTLVILDSAVHNLPELRRRRVHHSMRPSIGDFPIH